MNIDKRTTLMLLIVSIAFAGCYKKYEDAIGVTVERPTKTKDSKSSSALRAENVRLMKDISLLKSVQNQNKTLLFRISDLETSLDSKSRTLQVVTDKFQSEQRKVQSIQNQHYTLLTKISELEVMLETQSAVEMARFERLENVVFVYEVAIEAQSVTIDTLQKLCRLYESSAEKDSGGP